MYESPASAAMMMFGGSPTRVAVPPMLRSEHLGDDERRCRRSEPLRRSSSQQEGVEEPEALVAVIRIGTVGKGVVGQLTCDGTGSGTGPRALRSEQEEADEPGRGRREHDRHRRRLDEPRRQGELGDEQRDGERDAGDRADTDDDVPSPNPFGQACQARGGARASTASAIPRGLPTILEARMPSPRRLLAASATRDRTAGRRRWRARRAGPPCSSTRADRSASARASGETASRDRRARSSHCAASASGGSGSSSVRSATRCASALTCRGRWKATAGVRNAMTTPASVGATPPASSATHDASASTTYTTTARTPIRHRTANATKIPSATAEGQAVDVARSRRRRRRRCSRGRRRSPA